MSFVIAALFIACLVVLSMRADRRLSGHDRLPMQWGLFGKPNWYAPRRIALYFAPALCGLILTPLAVVVQFIPTADSSAEGTALSVMVAIGAGYALVHLAYLWAVGRWATEAA